MKNLLSKCVAKAIENWLHVLEMESLRTLVAGICTAFNTIWIEYSGIWAVYQRWALIQEHNLTSVLVQEGLCRDNLIWPIFTGYTEHFLSYVYVGNRFPCAAAWLFVGWLGFACAAPTLMLMSKSGWCGLKYDSSPWFTVGFLELRHEQFLGW